MPSILTLTRSALLCGALALGAVAAQAQTFRWAAQNDILTLDPHSQNHATTNNIMAHVYEPLVRYDRDNRIQPALATSWSQLSATTWRFNLRKNVTFHDGSPFTADDVIFSFDRSRQPQGTMGIYVAGVTEIRKIDSHTIDVVLNGPNPLLLNNFTYFFIMNKAWAAKNRSEKVQDYKAGEIIHAARNTNGTGPFTLKEWQPDQRLVLNANKSWWDKMPGNVSEVIYTPIKSDATRVAALLAGNVDAVTDVPTQDVARLRANANLSILDGPEVRTIFIGFDMGSDELKHGSKGKNPFKDVRVRRALNMSVDRVAIQRTIMRGLSVPGMLLVAPGVNGYSADADKPVAVDVEAAKKLLAEAGYPNGFEVTLDCPNNRYINDEDICKALVTMWAQIGLKVSLNAMPRATFFPKIQKYETSAYLLGWGVATYDALYSLQSLARTRAGGGDGNYNVGRYSNPQMDALVERTRKETDLTTRNNLIEQALLLSHQDVSHIPLHNQVIPWAMRKNVDVVHRADNRLEATWVKIN